MSIKNLVLAGVVVASAMTGLVSAQQPGSVDYNSRVLPAHGLGDTRQEVLRWGAAAMGNIGRIGLASNAADEETARKNAIRNCEERGDTQCVVEAVYANGCIAIARNDDQGFIATAPTLREAKEKSLARCTGNCEVFRDECSSAN